MRVVVVHNRYRSAQPSGENRVVEADIAALEAEGVEVFPYIRDSDEIEGFTAIGKAGVAVRPLVSPVDSIAFRRLLRGVQPHIVHLHNPYPLISPWIVRTAKSMRVPVVQTVHNYRHVCANGLYFRDGHECTDCVGKAFPWPAIAHGCYRDSKLQSIPMATSLWAHRSTWMMVDRFLPVGEHVADHLRTFGIPDHKIIVRPNVVADPGEPKPLGHGALFVGRLSEEKGIRLLLAAWKLAGVGTEHTLTIAGDGELRPFVEAAAAADPSIRYLGLVPSADVSALYDAAALVVVPSTWQEADGLSAVNGLAAGRAVLACRIGAFPDYIDESCGWLSAATAAAVAQTLTVSIHDTGQLRDKGASARKRFLSTRSPSTGTRLSQLYVPLATLPRGSMVVVGPDGAGKSTLVASLAQLAEDAGVDVSRWHFKPGVLLERRDDGVAVEDPHAQAARPVLSAVARTALVWLDFLAGWLTSWRSASRRGLLLLERPWLDQAVDPRRYRLPPLTVQVVKALGRALPKADFCVQMVGDPTSIDRRKPEIGEEEVRRQQNAWDDNASAVGRKVIRVDSVAMSRDAMVSVVLEASLQRPTPQPLQWVRPLGYPTRLDMRVTSQPCPNDALRVYPPQKRIAIARERLGRGLLRLGLSRSMTSPPFDLDSVLDELDAINSPTVAMRSSKPHRWIVGIEQAGRLAVVIKSGALNDDGLVNEANMLRRFSGTAGAFRVPELLYWGQLSGRLVLAMRAVPAAGASTSPSIEEIAAICTSLTLGDASIAPIVHGDLAPWNLVVVGATTWILDWESARFARVPMWDLAHYTIRLGALLGRLSEREVLHQLTAPGSVGFRHLAATGEEPDRALSYLRAYLQQSDPFLPGKAERFRQELRRLVT